MMINMGGEMSSNIIRTGWLYPALLLSTFLAVGPALAGTMTITLDDVTVDTCDEVYREIGVPLWFTGTVPPDPNPGSCVFDPDANDYGLSGVHLGPARLIVDVGRVEGLVWIYIDIYINSLDARAVMLRGEEHLYGHGISNPGHQMLTLPCLGGDTVVIYARDTYVWEIRLEGDNLVPTEPVSFGCLKTTYGP
jgi:hypothetical protein